VATFECKVYKLTIEPHPNADAIELAKVGEYRSIVRKGQFKTGDLGVYIPEAAIVPDWLIEKMGLTGRLAGKQKNRVKAIKLRGVLSQGLIYETVPGKNDSRWIEIETENGPEMLKVIEGMDVANHYGTNPIGITKWEPPIPVHLAGEVDNAFGLTIKYDIENYKKWPDVLQASEEVVFTEKIHGTWCCFGWHPDREDYIVTSKGLSEKGLVFKLNDRNKNNVYIRALNSTIDNRGENIIERMKATSIRTEPFYILGEVFGPGVQDLQYGAKEVSFRIFDIHVGYPGKGFWVSHKSLDYLCRFLGVQRVPVLYCGPFSVGKMLEFTDGKETVSGTEANIREGIVITPTENRYDEQLGRVILKSVSEDYLLRKGNTTEFN